MAVAWSRSSETKGDLLLSDVGVLQKDTEFQHTRLTSGMEQKTEAEDEEEMEELSFVTECSQ